MTKFLILLLLIVIYFSFTREGFSSNFFKKFRKHIKKIKKKIKIPKLPKRPSFRVPRYIRRHIGYVKIPEELKISEFEKKREKQKKSDYEKMWKENNYIHLYNEDIHENIKKHYSYKDNNKMNYSDLKYYNSELPDNIPDDTECIYSYKKPSQSVNFNIDIEDPYKRYTTEPIKSKKYQFNYSDEPLNLNLNFYKQEKLDYSTPYAHYYSYCKLDKDKLPKCSLITCNNKKKHNNTLRLIHNNDKEINKKISERKLQILRRKHLNENRVFDSNSNAYLDKVLRF